MKAPHRWTSGGSVVERSARTKTTGGRIAAAGAALLCVGLATPPVTEASPAPARSPSQVSVPVSVLGGQGEPGGSSPTVQITVGGWGPIPVVLDTGSSGLHVFAGAVNPGSGVTVTDQTSNITYSGRLPVQRGGRLRRHATRRSDDDRIRLLRARTACLVHRLEARLPRRGRDPRIRVGQGRRWHPRHRNAGQRGRGDESHPRHGRAAGQEVEPASRRQLGTVRPGCPGRRERGACRAVPASARWNVRRPSAWTDSQIPLCVSAGSIGACVPALFDSGTPSTQISGSPLDQVPTVPGTTQVVSGTPITVASSGGAPFWSFTAGSANLPTSCASSVVRARSSTVACRRSMTSPLHTTRRRDM